MGKSYLRDAYNIIVTWIVSCTIHETLFLLTPGVLKNASSLCSKGWDLNSIRKF